MPILPVTRAQNDKLGRRKSSGRSVSSGDVTVIPPEVGRPRPLSAPSGAFESPLTIGAQELAPAFTETAIRLQEAEKREKDREEAVAILDARKKFREDLETRSQSLVSTTETMSKEELTNFGAETTASQEEILGSREWSPEARLKLLESFDTMGSTTRGSLSALAVKVHEHNAEEGVKRAVEPFVNSVKEDSSLVNIITALNSVEEEFNIAKNVLNPIKDQEVRGSIRETIVLAGLKAARDNGELQRANLLLRHPIIQSALTEEGHDKFVKSLKTEGDEKTAKIKNFEFLQERLAKEGESVSLDETKRFFGAKGDGDKTLKDLIDEFTVANGGVPPNEQQFAKLTKTFVKEGTVTENEKQQQVLMEKFGLNERFAFLVANDMASIQKTESGEFVLVTDTGENLGVIPRNTEEFVLESVKQNSQSAPSQGDGAAQIEDVSVENAPSGEVADSSIQEQQVSIGETEELTLSEQENSDLDEAIATLPSIRDAAELASGPVAAARRVIENYIGPFAGGEVLFPDTREATKVMEVFRQIMKAAIINNERFPQKEQETVNTILTDIEKTFTNPAAMQANIDTLEATLREFKRNKEIELKNPNTTDKGEADLRNQITRINEMLSMVGRKSKSELQVPKGLPPQSFLVGTKNGREVWEDPETKEQWIRNVPQKKSKKSGKVKKNLSPEEEFNKGLPPLEELGEPSALDDTISQEELQPRKIEAIERDIDDINKTLDKVVKRAAKEQIEIDKGNPPKKSKFKVPQSETLKGVSDALVELELELEEAIKQENDKVASDASKSDTKKVKARQDKISKRIEENKKKLAELKNG